jgi:hypothetical protein
MWGRGIAQLAALAALSTACVSGTEEKAERTEQPASQVTAKRSESADAPRAKAKTTPSVSAAIDAGAPARRRDAGSAAAVDAGRTPNARRSRVVADAGDAGVGDAGVGDAATDAGGFAQGPPSYRYVGKCEGIYVYIVSIAVENPEESSVSLSLTPDGTGRFRYVGDAIGRFEVLSITDDWSGHQPKVWLRDGLEVCQAGLAGNEKREKQAAQRAAAAARTRAAKRRKKRRRRKRRRRRR